MVPEAYGILYPQGTIRSKMFYFLSFWV